ncbi:MAG: carboxypeptidase regulatory-like domain-containing protein [Verrucomicrobiae bacterium]|nr:carboxypeptidase regulatory-like domain-containing protein [Verrucomicrobiae bacterium]
MKSALMTWWRGRNCRWFLPLMLPCVCVNLLAAVVEGQVFLRGTPPPEVPVDLTQFPDCRSVRQAPLTTRHYVAGTNGGLANVFVFIREGLQGRSFAVSTQEVVLDQYECGFHPYVLGVQTGQVLRIKNSEPYLETVHAVALTNKGFNIAQPPNTSARFKFDKQEILLRIKCEIHPWEFAYVGVVEHPFFAVTDARGSFRLPEGLPPGEYTVEAVHQKLGKQSQTIKVQEGQTVLLKFEFHSPYKATP